MKHKSRIRPIILTTLMFYIGSLEAQNNFAVGIVYPHNAMHANAAQTQKNIGYNCDIVTLTDMLYQGYPTSTLAQFSQDGFNTHYTFLPGEWGTSEMRIKTYLELTKKYNMKYLPVAINWFVPQSAVNDDNGFTCFNNDLSGPPSYQTNLPGYQNIYNNCKARTNYDYLLNNVYNLPLLQTTVAGVMLGGEYSFLHWFNPGTDPQATQYLREIPPNLVNIAIDHFNQALLPNQKTYVSMVNHRSSLHDNTEDAEWNPIAGNYENSPIDHDPQEYTNLPNKADVALEESYYQFTPGYLGEDYANILHTGGVGCAGTPCSNNHYLSKFKNIEYLLTKYPEVQATIGAESYVSPEVDYGQRHYNSTTINNANWLWFQTYTSIIHGATGIYIYSDYTYQNGEANIGKQSSLDADRYATQYFSNNYRSFISNLGQELRYLVNNNFLNSDQSNIIYNKKDKADENCIVPPITAYGGISALPAEKKTENYGLRYTIRTNGNEVVMIVANPLNVAVSATLNFNNVANQLIKNSTGVDVLFSSSSDLTTSSTYKTARNSTIDLSANTVGQQYYKAFTGTKDLAMSFGPLDVIVLKFRTTTPVVNTNGWEKVWSNNGTGNIGGWTASDFDKFYPGDYNGDGLDELLCVQTGTNRNFMAMLKYNAGNWTWVWSSSTANHPLLPYRDKLIVGDYDGNGKDEVLGNLLSGWTTMFGYDNADFVWYWSDYGNHPLTAYKDQLVPGDYDGDGKDELLGADLPSGMTTMFNYDNGNFVAGWSDNGVTTHPIRPYRSNMKSGDFDGDGKDEILGLAASATIFTFVNNNFSNTWSTNGATTLGGWSYPLATGDVLLIGNLDGDVKDELMFIQTGTSAAWSATMDFNTTQNGWTWNWSASPSTSPYINDWAIGNMGGSDTRYHLIHSVNYKGLPNQLLSLRKFGCTSNYNYLASLYTSTGINKFGDQTPDSELFNDLTLSDQLSVVIFPNPSSGRFIVVLGDYVEQVKISVTDQNGKIYTTLLSNETNNVELNLEDLANGLYFVTISNNMHKTTQKIQIQK